MFLLKSSYGRAVAETLFAATGGYATTAAASPFVSVSPLELVAKNFHAGAAATTGSISFSQVWVVYTKRLLEITEEKINKLL